MTSLSRAAMGVESGTAAVLLAARVRAWTFIYDGSGVTSHDGTMPLSANGRSVATCMYTINDDTSLSYAANVDLLDWITGDDLVPETDVSGLPADLRVAFDAAAVFEPEGGERGEVDCAVGIRAICALASLTCTLEELGRTPLLVTTFG